MLLHYGLIVHTSSTVYNNEQGWLLKIEPFQPSFAALAETAVRCELVLDDDGDGMVTVTRSDPE